MVTIHRAKVTNRLVDFCSQMIYNSVIGKTIDKIEIDAKIVSRTNVCYKEEKQMEEVTKTLLEYATYEELLILLNLAESMLQPSERTQPSALVS